MKILLFGAGNIGRGLIGKILAEQAGSELTFADVAQPLIDQLNQQQAYPVQTVGEQPRTEWVQGIKALNSRSEAAVQAVATADLITTAVGPTVLQTIADIIARGLLQRQADKVNSYLNIIACENILQASTRLKCLVLEKLPQQVHPWVEQQVGFVDAVVDCIVPPAPPTAVGLTITVEPFSEWIIDRTQIKGRFPAIIGLELSDNLTAFIERKLFTLNTGHAITAYLGYLAGAETIHQAILDPQIAGVVYPAMQESGALLIKQHGFDPQQHARYIENTIDRFKNPLLNDVVTRVGRQPLRKLGSEDRLIKPLVGAFANQLSYSYLVKGVVAALRYHHEADPEAVHLQQLIAQRGINTALCTFCGLEAEPKLVAEISSTYRDQMAVASRMKTTMNHPL